MASAPLRDLAGAYGDLRAALRRRITEETAAAAAVSAELSALAAQRKEARAAQMAAVSELVVNGEKRRCQLEASVHSLDMEVSELSNRAARADVVKRKKVETLMSRIEQTKERAALLNSKVTYERTIERTNDRTIERTNERTNERMGPLYFHAHRWI